MVRQEGELHGNFTPEPLFGEALDRALERGQAAAVRRTDAITKRKEAASSALRDAKQDKVPLVWVTTQVEIPEGDGTRTKLEKSLVPTPNRRRPQPGERIVVAMQEEERLDGSEIPPLVEEADLLTDTAQRVWGDDSLSFDDGDQASGFDPYCTDVSIATGGFNAVLGQSFPTPDEVELADGYVDAREQVQ